jgi:hypothetical protein
MHSELLRDLLDVSSQKIVEVGELELNCFERIIHAHETRVHFSIRIHHCLFFIDEQVQMEALQRA